MSSQDIGFATALNELARQAAAYRDAVQRGDRAAQKSVAEAFRADLVALESLGWQHALGESAELPDDELPDDYLRRREIILDSLENELGRLAMDYRSALTPAAADIAIRRYEEVMLEMFRIGHWSGVPDPDSQLPLEDMPEEYRRRRIERIRRHQAAQQQIASPSGTKGQP